MRGFSKKIAAMIVAVTMIIMMLPAGVMADELIEETSENAIMLESSESSDTDPQTTDTESKETESTASAEETESIKETETQSEEKAETETETKAEADESEEKISKTIQIVWDDSEDKDQVRPESIEVILCKDGDEIPDQKVTLTSGNANQGSANIWEYTWKELPKYTQTGEIKEENPAEIEYSVKVSTNPLGYYLSNKKLYEDGLEIFQYTHKKINNTITIKNEVTSLDQKPEEAEKFEFVLEADAEKSELPEGMTNMPMPAGSEGQTAKLTIDGEGSESFAVMSFSDIGTFYYNVKEINGTDEDYTYDDSVYTVRYTIKTVEKDVPVSDEAKAAGLKKETNYTLDAKRAILNEKGKVKKEITFNNTYGAEEESESETEDEIKPLSYTLKVKKSISYKNDVQPDSPATFTFVLKPESTGETPMPEGASSDSASVSITGEGTVSFEKIRFTEAGTYTYTCSEVYDGLENYIYDDYDCTIKVTVTLNKDENKLEGDAEVIKNSSGEDKKISTSTARFSNGYGYGSGLKSSSSSSSGSSSSGSGSGASTGDSTPVTMLIIVLCAALAAAVFAGISLLRKKHE